MKQIEDLLDVMSSLRDPERGCPWDSAQDFASVAPYTLEEAYEVVDAIERCDMDALQEELGDLLFQVVFHARMAGEQGFFDFAAVAQAATDKMKRRHPHVFGEQKIEDVKAQTAAWEEQKARERSGRDHGALDGIPVNLPALSRAQKMGRRAARAGFDWPDADSVLKKLDEERAELEQAIFTRNEAPGALEEELGDLLFATVSLARHLEVDAEGALRRALLKFDRRFRWVEDTLAGRGQRMDETNDGALDALWRKAKELETGR